MRVDGAVIVDDDENAHVGGRGWEFCEGLCACPN